MLELHLPFPPTVNTYWRSVPGKGVLISAGGRSYRKAVADCVLVQRGAKHLAKRLAVEIFAFPPDKRQRDLDNLTKGLLDSLTHAGVWGDDGQIDDLRIRRGFPTKGGLVRIEIREIE